MVRKSMAAWKNEDIHLSDYQSKIEIIRCPQQKKECVPQLPLINRCFSESQQLRMNKDYRHSIQVLEQAFELTFDMCEGGCETCSSMFRSVIISTLETIQSDLQGLTTGRFSVCDYKTVLEYVTQVLQAFRNRK